MLQKAGACGDQVATFRRLFGEGGTVTLARCRRAVAAGLDLHWAGDHLLTGTALGQFDRATAPLRAECRQATGAACAEFYATLDAVSAEYKKIFLVAQDQYAQKPSQAAWSKFRRTYEAAWAKLTKTMEAAWAKRMEVEDTARAKSNQGAAIAFYEAWNEQRLALTLTK